MKLPMSGYSTLVFDCDGVVLDSNEVKTRAFYKTTLPYGESAAQAMVDHHVANGGISRYKKFAFFLDEIACGRNGPGLNSLLDTYASHVREGLLLCNLASGIDALRSKTPDARWLIVSGGDQVELRDIFTQRCIADWFDGGIFGSPDTKIEILERELVSGNIQTPALFLGDSKYDHQAASTAGLDFVFLSSWSEVADWQAWAAREEITTKLNISELLE